MPTRTAFVDSWWVSPYRQLFAYNHCTDAEDSLQGLHRWNESIMVTQGTTTILRTRLMPPRPQRYLLARPRVEALLREALDYRLTLLLASTGYGKSTALASLAKLGVPLFWYGASESDADPARFLSYLIAAF